MAQGTLLHRVLHLLSDGGIHSTGELARQLGVGEELVRSMADDLAGHGYLAPMAAICPASCSGCQVAPGCHGPETAPRMLALTARGRQAAQRVQQTSG